MKAPHYGFVYRRGSLAISLNSNSENLSMIAFIIEFQKSKFAYI